MRYMHRQNSRHDLRFSTDLQKNDRCQTKMNSTFNKMFRLQTRQCNYTRYLIKVEEAKCSPEGTNILTRERGFLP